MAYAAQIDNVVFAILIAGVMPVVCAGIAKCGHKDCDNRNPRVWLSRLKGFRARANAARQNCLEVFPFFAVGAILAALSGSDGDSLEAVTWFFVVVRIAYVACYLLDKPTMRSVFWSLGYVSAIYLYTMA